MLDQQKCVCLVGDGMHLLTIFDLVAFSWYEWAIKKRCQDCGGSVL
ncbi:hypothetical protein [Rubritalea tangerina]